MPCVRGEGCGGWWALCTEFVLVVIVSPGGIPVGRASDTGVGPDVVDTLLSALLLPLLVLLMLLLLLLLLVLLALDVLFPAFAAISSFNRLVMCDFICFRR